MILRTISPSRRRVINAIEETFDSSPIAWIDAVEYGRGQLAASSFYSAASAREVHVLRLRRAFERAAIANQLRYALIVISANDRQARFVSGSLSRKLAACFSHHEHFAFAAFPYIGIVIKQAAHRVPLKFVVLELHGFFCNLNYVKRRLAADFDECFPIPSLIRDELVQGALRLRHAAAR